MFAFTDGLFAENKMGGCGSDDVNHITDIHQLGGVGKAGELVFTRDFPGYFVIGVIESYQFRRLDLFPVIQMKFAQVTDAKYTYFKHLL
jgi:hypothetical protein